MENIDQMREAVLEIETFLKENYEFRRNLLSGKTEWSKVSDGDEQTRWSILTAEALNSIVRKAKLEGIGGKSPRINIEEFIGSDAIPDFDPIIDYLEHLPSWDALRGMAEKDRCIN